MIIACIGDSLTEGDYGIKGVTGIANVHSENYPYFLAQKTGWKTLNYGKCGFKSSDFLSWYEAGNADVTSADVILVMLGTNGGQSETGESDEDRCYGELIRRFEKDAPKAKIILVTPPHATENPAYSNCGYNPQVTQAAKFVRLFAQQHGYPVIDINADPRIREGLEEQNQPNDGLHMGRQGYELLADMILEGMKK